MLGNKCKNPNVSKINTMNSPDDNTTVFRMMGEFKNYIAKDIGKIE